MAPVADRAAQQHPPQRQRKEEQVASFPPSDDDLLETAPPAFPQPVSSLPRPAGQLYQYPAAAITPAAAAGFTGSPPGNLPVSVAAGSFARSGSQQLLQQQHWAAAAAASAGGAAHTSHAPGTGPAAAAGWQPGAAAAGATAAAQFGYTVDGLPLPYDVAMAPYAAAVYQANYGNSMYGNDVSLPLLTEAGCFNGDMVFANRQMRHAFIRKVLGLLTVQLLLTAAVAMPILTKKHVRRFVHINSWVFFLALVLSATLLLVLACSEAARRRHPTNLLLLGAFTLAQGCLVGTASATYATNAPVLCVLITAAVSLALIVYASQTSVDFTASGGMLYSAVVVLLVVSLAERFLGFNTLQLLVAGCGALLFCAYLVYDVQLQASGESLYAISAEEYMVGAINVYTDVINLFLYFVQVVCPMRGGHDELH